MGFSSVLWMCEQSGVPRVWSGGLDKNCGYVRGWVAESLVREVSGLQGVCGDAACAVQVWSGRLQFRAVFSEGSFSARLRVWPGD